MDALPPQRLSSTIKHAQVDGILTPSKMSCLSAGCRCKDLAVFCRVLDPSCPSRVPNSLAVFHHQFLSREGAAHNKLSVGKNGPSFYVVIVFHPAQPASKVECAFLCLSLLKHNTARSLLSVAVRHNRVAVPTDRPLALDPSATGTISDPCFGVVMDNTYLDMN